jgi:nitrate reductase NapE component
MRGRTIRLVVAIGVALVGISAIGSVIAYSAVVWITQEIATKPLPPTPAEFRLNDQQQLRQIFKPFRSPVSGR